MLSFFFKQGCNLGYKWIPFITQNLGKKPITTCIIFKIKQGIELFYKWRVCATHLNDLHFLEGPQTHM